MSATLERRKPGPTSRARRAKAAKRLRAYQLVCAQIDQERGENGYVPCARCGRWVMGIQHHHTRPRSLAPELRTVKENIEAICADCHRQAHAAQNWTKGHLQPVTTRMERG